LGEIIDMSKLSKGDNEKLQLIKMLFRGAFQLFYKAAIAIDQKRKLKDAILLYEYYDKFPVYGTLRLFTVYTQGEKTKK
jgi:hypothetical protein